MPGVVDGASRSRPASPCSPSTLLGGQEGPRRAQGRVGRRATRSSSSHRRHHGRVPRRWPRQPGKPWRARRATPPRRIAGAAKVLEATYEFPYLAHARDGAAELRRCSSTRRRVRDLERRRSSRPSTRSPSRQYLGLKPEQVKINTLFAGGSFGRRANAGADYVLEARRSRIALARRAAQRPGQAGVDARGRHARRATTAPRSCTR